MDWCSLGVDRVSVIWDLIEKPYTGTNQTFKKNLREEVPQRVSFSLQIESHY